MPNSVEIEEKKKSYYVHFINHFNQQKRLHYEVAHHDM